MKKIIVGIPNCMQCKTLASACPDVEKVEVEPSDILNFARAVGIKSMPFVVAVGEPHELQKELSVNVIN